MNKINYDDYKFFLDRYRHIVFAFIAQDLYEYVDYPTTKCKKAYRDEVRQFFVNGRFKVPEGPYKTETYHIFMPYILDPVLEVNQIGPSQYDNFIKELEKAVEFLFPRVIENYASKDCDFKYCRDCANDLVARLKRHWHLV